MDSFGRIVFTSSASGAFGSPEQTNYGAAKAGPLGLTNCLGWQGRKHGVRQPLRRSPTTSPTASPTSTDTTSPSTWSTRAARCRRAGFGPRARPPGPEPAFDVAGHSTC
ncbi:SDR family NAD(P)-dependent oxidoreductase [Streptomyces sp. NPDC046862]|uniref:SDR family NAD(P)-dependent oxidoreductase n=1 Tax=Streptomyces sp. NPDC046862 TaxID=3154603 RepID=UPI0034522329